MLQLKVRMKAIVHCLKNAPLPPQNITDFFVTLIEDGNYFNSNFLWPCERQNLEFNELGGTRNVISGAGTDGDIALDDDEYDDDDDDVDDEMNLSPFLSRTKQDEKEDNATDSLTPNNDVILKDKDTPNNDPSTTGTNETQPFFTESSVVASSAIPGQSSRVVVVASSPKSAKLEGAMSISTSSSKRNSKQPSVPPPPLNPKNVVTLPSQPDVPLDIGRARMLLQVNDVFFLFLLLFQRPLSTWFVNLNHRFNRMLLQNFLLLRILVGHVLLAPWTCNICRR